MSDGLFDLCGSQSVRQHRGTRRVDGVKSTQTRPRHRINKMLHVRKTVVEPPLAVELLDTRGWRALALPSGGQASGLRQLNAETTLSNGVARRDDYALVLRQRLPVDLVEVHLVVRRRDSTANSSAIVRLQVLPTCTNRTSTAVSLAVAVALRLAGSAAIRGI